MTALKIKLMADFANKEYAHSQMQSNCVERIAAQIRALRKQRMLSQKDLAKLSGFTQERISKIESGNFDSLTMTTLNRLAEAFDVKLCIEFKSVSDGIQDIVDLSSASHNIASRSEVLINLAYLIAKAVIVKPKSEL